MVNDLYKKLIERAYNEAETRYTFDTCLNIISYFFDKYYEVMGRKHLPPNHKQLVNIISKMDWLESNDPDEMDIDYNDFDFSEYYPALIDQYFDTDLQCDYSIHHFFSGRIRLNRMYELPL